MLDERIRELVDEQEREGGICIDNLAVGTKIEVRTKNSLYVLTVVDPAKQIVKVIGGKHLPEEIEVIFQGSTFGGSILKPGWIGHEMYMEMTIKREHKNVLTTGPVKSAKVIAGDGTWEYKLEWS